MTYKEALSLCVKLVIVYDQTALQSMQFLTGNPLQGREVSEAVV